MPADVIQLRDYRNREEREALIAAIGFEAVRRELDDRPLVDTRSLDRPRPDGDAA